MSCLVKTIQITCIHTHSLAGDKKKTFSFGAHTHIVERDTTSKSLSLNSFLLQNLHKSPNDIVLVISMHWKTTKEKIAANVGFIVDACFFFFLLYVSWNTINFFFTLSLSSWFFLCAFPYANYLCIIMNTLICHHDFQLRSKWFTMLIFYWFCI